MKTFSDINQQEAIDIAKALYPEIFEKNHSWKYRHCENEIDYELYLESEPQMKFVFDNWGLSVTPWMPFATMTSWASQWATLKQMWKVGVLPKWCQLGTEETKFDYLFVNFLQVLDTRQQKLFISEAIGRMNYEDVESVIAQYNQDRKELEEGWESLRGFDDDRKHPRVFNAKQIAEIVLPNGVKYPNDGKTRIELDKKSNTKKKIHTIFWQYGDKWGQVGDYCYNITHQELFELAKKQMIKIN